MLLDFRQIAFSRGLDITGVIHVGAHLAEEAPVYDDLGVEKVWWIEANYEVLTKINAILYHYPNQHLIHALIADKNGETRTFNVTNYDGMSSSIFEFGTHTQFSPDTVFEKKIEMKTHTLDSVAKQWDFSGCNMLSMDIQGAEKLALLGAKELLPQIDIVYSEVNNQQVYVGCAQVEELDEILHEFDRVETSWVGDQGWGDGLWLRK